MLDVKKQLIVKHSDFWLSMTARIHLLHTKTAPQSNDGFGETLTPRNALLVHSAASSSSGVSTLPCSCCPHCPLSLTPRHFTLRHTTQEVKPSLPAKSNLALIDKAVGDAVNRCAMMQDVYDGLVSMSFSDGRGNDLPVRANTVVVEDISLHRPCESLPERDPAVSNHGICYKHSPPSELEQPQYRDCKDDKSLAQLAIAVNVPYVLLEYCLLDFSRR